MAPIAFALSCALASAPLPLTGVLAADTTAAPQADEGPSAPVGQRNSAQYQKRRQAGLALQWTGTVVIAGGIGLGIAATVFTVQFEKGNTQLDKDIEENDTSDSALDDRAELIDDIERKQDLAMILGLTGIGVIAVGTALYFGGRKLAPADRSVVLNLPAPAVAPGYAGVGWSGRF